VHQQNHLCIFRVATRDAQKVSDANVDRHGNAVDGTTDHHALAREFDVPYAIVGAAIAGIVASRKEKRVGLRCAARPSRM